jgi:hypothetical protein
MKKIKTFYQYNVKSTTNRLKCLITEEEISDQFLRIEEIYGFTVDIFLEITVGDNNKEIGCYIVYCDLGREGQDESSVDSSKIEDELMSIKNRMENQFPINFKFLQKKSANGMIDYPKNLSNPKDYIRIEYSPLLQYAAVITLK